MLLTVGSLCCHTQLRRGIFFEGDIRLKPGEDPYNIFHRWMQPRTVRSPMPNQIPLTPSPEVGSGEDIEFESARLWPGKRIPYKWYKDLGKYISYQAMLLTQPG